MYDYGALGQQSFIFHDRQSAAAVTLSGVSIITTLIQNFESFLADNWEFECYGDVIDFISEVNITEMEFDSIVEKDKTVEEVYERLISKVKLKESDKELEELILSILETYDEEILNRIYYKNNLYEFFEEPVMIELIGEILEFDIPSGNPGDIEHVSIKEKLDEFNDIIRDYVVWTRVYEDRLTFADTTTRKAVLVVDTDSTFLFLDPFVKFVEKFYDYDTSVQTNSITVCNILIFTLSFLSETVLSEWCDKSNIELDKKHLINLKNELTK